MSKREWRVAVGPDAVSAEYEPATSGDEIGVFVGAHGAGGNMSDRSVLATANAMRKHGIGVVRFNFIYKEKKSSRPDPMPKCMDVIRAVVAQLRAEVSPKRVIIGGRSMGGRAASMLAAEEFEADGLLLLAYPLHPPGRPDKLRDAHLPDIRMPVLAFSGTRDPFISRDLMDSVLAKVTAPWDMRWVEAADHSFHVPKSSGQTDAGVMESIAESSRGWITGLS